MAHEKGKGSVMTKHREMQRPIYRAGRWRRHLVSLAVVVLAGKSHGGIETPHTKVSERNLNAPNQPAYNTKSATVRASTQQDIRTARRYLDKGL